MFKKIKDEKLQLIKDQNMQDALMKLEGQVAESLINEEELLD